MTVSKIIFSKRQPSNIVLLQIQLRLSQNSSNTLYVNFLDSWNVNVSVNHKFKHVPETLPFIVIVHENYLSSSLGSFTVSHYTLFHAHHFAICTRK